MKKFIFLLIISLFAISCSVVTETYDVTTYGDISVLGYDGKVIREYRNSLIGNEEHTLVTYWGQTTNNVVSRFDATKLDGSINFVDSNNDTHYVSGGIIIIDNVETISGFGNTKYGKKYLKKVAADTEKENDINEYYKIIKEHKYFLGELKKFKKNTEDYKRLQEKINSLENEKKERENLLWRKYHFSERVSY